MSLSSDEENAEATNAILEELRTHPDAPQPVKRLLKAYMATSNHSKNMTTMNRYSENTLHATAVFFGAKPTDEEGEPTYRSKATLCDWIIMAIEELFPQPCLACNSFYTLKRGAKPKFRCASCGGGSHDCANIMSEQKSEVQVWICGECTGKFKLEKFAGTQENPPPSASSQRKFSFQTVPADEVVTKGELKMKEDDKEGKEPEEPHLPTKLDDVCPFYLRKKCRHGRYGTKKWKNTTCPKKHPELCRKFCNYGTTRHAGCNRGTECKFFHPPLCRASETMRKCFKVDCQHQHLKHTDRYDDDDGGWQLAGDRNRKATVNHQPRPRNNSSGNRDRSRSRSRNASNSSQTAWNRSRNPSREETDNRKTEEDFFERLLVRLSDKLTGLVANEVNKQKTNLNQPNVSWSIPHGMTLTQSAR